MAKGKKEIISEIKHHISKEGSPYAAWYVGVTEQPQIRLFDDHSVDKDNGWWIFIPAQTSLVAREIERYFLEALGADGGPRGGDREARYVYAYRKALSTDP